MSQTRQLAAIMFTDIVGYKCEGVFQCVISKIYSEEYFQSEAHQNILKKMGFVK
jgi:hypothetical protein